MSSSTGFSISRCPESETSAASTRIRSTAGATTTLGIREQLIFPEIEYDKIDKVRGMDIVLCHHRENRRGSPRAAYAHGRPVCEIRRERRGQNINEDKAEKNAEVFDARLQQMQDLRPAARLSSQIRSMPHLFPQPGLQGRYPRREESKLVTAQQRRFDAMQITDSIADMLTRIRNANTAKHDTVDIPASNMKKAIAQILLDEGYIKGYQVIEDGKQGTIRVTLKYGRRTSPRWSQACAGSRSPDCAFTRAARICPRS
jgi:hypothetical protein